MFSTGKIEKIAQQAGFGSSSREFAKLFLISEKANSRVAKLEGKYGHGILPERQKKKLETARTAAQAAQLNLSKVSVKFNPDQVIAFNAALKQNEASNSKWKSALRWIGGLTSLAGASFAFIKIKSVFDTYRADFEAKTHLGVPSVPEYLSASWLETTGILIAGVFILGASVYFRQQEKNAFNLQDRFQLPKTSQ